MFAISAPWYSQWVIDEVLVSGDLDLLSVLALGFGLLLLIQLGLQFARAWLVSLLNHDVVSQWLHNVMAHLLTLKPAFFERRQLGDLASRFGSVAAIQRTITGSAVEAILDGLMAGVALGMMLMYAPTLAGVVALAAAAYALLRWVLYQPLRNAAAERLMISAKESTHFLETLRAMTALKLHGREQERRSAWQHLMLGVQSRDLRTARIGMAFNLAQGLIFGLENLLIVFLGARWILQAQPQGTPALTVGMLFAFMAYKTQFTSRVGSLINHAIEFRMLGLHTERLADITLEPPESPAAVPRHELEHLPPSLELRNIGFRYSDDGPWVLRHLNMVIDPGESVALAGASGSGKTTLLKIALGLLKPTEGEVLFGGVPIQQLGLDNFRRQIGAVLQDDTLLSGSLADNISFFDAQPDPQRMARCAQMAQLHVEIMRMPMGYQTQVGDLGQGLSGGQRQRLLLARALYKQPRLLALDEATSHLDVHNERAINAAVRGMSLTRLIIAHRPETLAAADRVLDLGSLLSLHTAQSHPPTERAVPIVQAVDRSKHPFSGTSSTRPLASAT